MIYTIGTKIFLDISIYGRKFSPVIFRGKAELIPRLLNSRSSEFYSELSIPLNI